MPEQPGPIPRAILVPIAEWDEHWRARPYGVSWLCVHEEAILDRAYALGWRPPKPYTSRTADAPTSPARAGKVYLP
jgi:hypothetical protein